MKLASILILLVSVLLFSCKDKQSDDSIRSFYFPLEKLKTPHVYVYKPEFTEARPPYYVIYQSEENGDSTFLNTWSIDHNFLLQYASRMKVVENGVLAKTYDLLEIDSISGARRIRTEIESPNVFPFEERDSNILYVFRMKWFPGLDSSKYNTLIRNRWQKGLAQYVYAGDTLPAYVLGIKEIVDQYDDGYLQYEARGEEVYAKNIGLVYLDKAIGQEYRLTYRLDTIFTLTDFEKEKDVNIKLPDSAF